MFVSNIEQFPRWRRVWYANGVDPACGHFFEIIIDLLKIAVFVPFLIRLKRTIADAFDVDFLAANENEALRRCDLNFLKGCCGLAEGITAVHLL